MNGNTCRTSSTGSTLSFLSAHFCPLPCLFTFRCVVYVPKTLSITMTCVGDCSIILDSLLWTTVMGVHKS